ncbi:MAG: helix-turn-helix domain-containing protein [Chryseotalea sp.]|jgi:AraC family transcriptional activator of pobA|nr:AraC family transcriptional regulator [Cytophagales bacterium]
MTKTTQIPFYKEINDFLEGINSIHRTKDLNFFCLRMEDTYPHTRNVMPPFKKAFYFISFVTNAGNTAIQYDQNNESKLDSFLVCQSPGHVYSWHRDKEVKGYLIYFKKELFNFFRPDLEKEFPFFNVMHTNFFRINRNTFQKYEPAFKSAFAAYDNAIDPNHRLAAIRFLEVLYQLKEFTAASQQWSQGFSTPQQIVYQKLLQLINNYYIEKRTVEAYAELMNISAKHLSQTIKQTTGKNALSFINDRLVAEAKTLIQFTSLDISEIAYQLNFSDPANFGKFFKKHAQLTPLEFRKTIG